MRPSLRQCQYSRDTVAHQHACHQLVLPLSGELEIEIDGQHGKVVRGTAASIPAGAIHAFSARGSNRFLVLDYADALPVRPAEPDARFFAYPAQLPRLAMRGLRSTTPDQAALQLLVQIESSDRSRARSDALARIQSAMKRMQAQPADAHDTPTLAAGCGLSRSRFHYLFQAATGLAPQTWLSELRLDLAERLLRQGIAAAEVALRCGFSEQSALHRALLRERGVRPGELGRLG